MQRRDFSNRGKTDFNLDHADMDIMGELDQIARAKQVRIADITIDQSLQVRVHGLDENTVQEYMTTLTNGEGLPAIRVYRLEDDTLLLSSGFHRLEAHKRLEREFIAAEIVTGTRRDAVEYAYEDNRKHGLKLTNQDKRAFLIARLLDGTWFELSNQELGRRLGVDHKTVADWIKKHNESTGENSPVERTHTVGRDGKRRDTSGIVEANRKRAKPEITPGIKSVSEEALKPRSEAQAKNLIAYLKQEIDNVLLLIEQQQWKAHPNTLHLQDLNKKLSVLQKRRDAIAETLPTQPGTVKQVTVDWSGETPVVKEMTSVEKARGIIVNMGGLLDKLSEVLRRNGAGWTDEEWQGVSSDFQRFLDRCQALVTEE